jgi:peptidoglycan pentaglycine glycine transferase (the first glycine)
MKFIRVGENQRQAWNDFVQSSPNSSVLQSYEWGTVKRGTWKPIYAAVTDDQENFIATALILKRKLPVFNRSLLYCPRGPVCKSQDEKWIRFFFQAVKDLAKKEKAFVFRCDPEIPENDSTFVGFLNENGLRHNSENIQPRGTVILDIRPSEDSLLKSFHPKTRYNIKLAQKKDVVIEEKNSPEGVDIFYELFRVTGERDRFLILGKGYFMHLWKTLSENSMCSVFVAYFEGRPLAAIFQTVYGRRMNYLYGASSNEHRNLMPNHLIHWHAIQWAKKRGVEFYDFWGIPANISESSPLVGVYRFKKGFCETETRWIGTYELIFSGFWHLIFEKAARWFKTTVRFIKTGRMGGSLDE